MVWEYTYLSEYVIVGACMITIYTYHMSNSHESIGVNGEALQLHAVHKSRLAFERSRIRLSLTYI